MIDSGGTEVSSVVPTTPTPPAPPTPPTPPTVRSPRVGELTTGWRTMLAAVWLGAFFAYAAVWKISEELGIGTWWLGPRADRQPIWITVLPFAISITIVLLASSTLRRLPWISLGASLVLIVIAVPDLSRSVGIAVVELTIAGATLLVSLASFTGTYRLAR